MFTLMLSDLGSGCAKLEGMQKWVTLTQLELRKFISERALCKNSGFHGAQPFLLMLLRTNLRIDVGQVILSDLGSPRCRPKPRIQVQVVYLGVGPRKHQSGTGGREIRRQFVKGVLSS